jgi:ATP-binding cassette subfamily B protein
MQKKSIFERVMGSLRLKRAMGFVWESSRRLMLINGAVIFMQSVLPLVVLLMIKQIVDEVSSSLNTPNPTDQFNSVATLVLIAGVATMLIVIFRTIGEYVREALTHTVTDHMYDILHAKSIEVDLEYYENPQYHDTLHRAQQEASFRPQNIVERLLRLGQSGISLLAIAGLLFTLHWVVALVLFVSVFPGLLVRLRYSKQVYHWQRRRTETERQAKYYDLMLTDSAFAKEIRLFGLGDLFLGRFHNLRSRLRHERLEIIKRRSSAALVTAIVTILLEFGTYLFIAYRTLNGDLSLGGFVLYFEAFRLGQESLINLLYSVADLYEDNLFLTNLYEFLDLDRRVLEPEDPKTMPQSFQQGFEIKNLEFQYPALTREVLKDINMTIKPGEVVALVGENGSGKTTLIKLLCRLYDPTGGHITLDNTDISEFETVPYRRQISVLFQDYTHFNLTVQENIWFGNINAEPDIEKIKKVTANAGVAPVVDNLPNGYDTMLGKWFEDGEELSIGEWQKIALARAYLRDAPIIMLDEPTSALDARAEHEVFERFRELIKGKTAIMISHRLSTVKMADCIYVLDHGRIVEQGKHDDLVALGGKYAQLFEMQAQYYR